MGKGNLPPAFLKKAKGAKAPPKMSAPMPKANPFAKGGGKPFAKGGKT